MNYDIDITSGVPFSKDDVIKNITDDYLDTLDKDNLPAPEEMTGVLLAITKNAFDQENQFRKTGKWKIPDGLFPSQIASILLYLYEIVRIAFAGVDETEEYDMLAIYQTSGENKGLYSTDQEEFTRHIREYNYTINRGGIQEVMSILRTYAPRVARCADPKLVALNNGIFDFDSKTLMPFSPEYIFTAKSRVDYNPYARNVVIHNDTDGTDWDVESWIKDLYDDSELEQLTWELLGAILRPNVPWNKSAWFISETGNNGKGTLCSLMRSLTGKGTFAVIPLTMFSKDFMLEPLIKANAVIVDENSVGIYIDKADNLKAVITGDMILVNRKYKTPVAFRFRGMIIECVNEVPRVRDRSESFMRRFLMVPFRKCFTGHERKYIKEDYLKRKEVLEYVLYKVMNMDNYELSYPSACVEMMREFRLNNDPVSQFIDEVLPQCQWDFIPYEFLYETYTAWRDENCQNSPKLNKHTFLNEVRRVIETSTDWYDTVSSRKVGNKMNATEPLIAKYHLSNWYNPTYRGTDVEKLCHPIAPTNARGFMRKKQDDDSE